MRDDIDRTVTTGREEYHIRVERLVEERGMTLQAATIVVDAAMYGIGCIEGTMRKQIQEKIDRGENL